MVWRTLLYTAVTTLAYALVDHAPMRRQIYVIKDSNVRAGGQMLQQITRYCRRGLALSCR